MDVANGCMNFTPYSHREAVAHLADYERTPSGVATRDNGAGTYFDRYPEWASRDAVPVPLKAGSCTFHNGLTLHGAGVNMTPRRRRAMTCAYMPDGSLFNGGQNVLPDSCKIVMLSRFAVLSVSLTEKVCCCSDFQTLTMGQPLDNNELNPLVYAQPRM